MIKMAKKGEAVKTKNYMRKIKTPITIYADFEIILAPENSWKQNPDESYTNKNQNYIGCRFHRKLVYIDHQFSKPNLFNLDLGQDAVRKFIITMIKESKYCSHVMKKYFTKELVIIKEDHENFEFVIALFLKVILKEEIIVTSLKILGILHTEIVISTWT